MSVLIRSRIDEVEAQSAELILSQLGLNMSEYLRFAVRSLNNRKGIPFDMTITNPETLKAIDDMNNRRGVIVSSLEEFEAKYQE
ncbi:type II toxin-antitoxin system antitoxin, RelB/DinJ family [Pantoea sp. Al-1710]|uniref:Type II toxin-antitoxin system antitoxin, RelB/DinJ family n=1 Tax=Candidatus Pantoea communis TaxID=2608354 RepID=A0ABX0RNN4_9GAMM|nr:MULTISPECIES: type II toxin-antitoxin system RelB/DinJ family antitoxin [Pantoea]NIG13024.1 type II toxin-antitoxin system antitoxin, RelB/DinJ family [Pantoea sp. Cy-640]NIG17275.1 type II toxin-antitoxin system antitoxin, RelB/DinJ family [Pantoea communis]